ncbi:hypothetical protein B0H16DRAFT_1458550 [Mycena metata]|uniref:Uncharacterized protein n=1 Tax=Mycena metata TaxID=1033252 RepID=A0AAD7J2J3_9AGAR|nr:hypothetical protein B0H16DRAFT_1458550 [Mycena metata]
MRCWPWVHRVEVVEATHPRTAAFLGSSLTHPRVWPRIRVVRTGVHKTRTGVALASGLAVWLRLRGLTPALRVPGIKPHARTHAHTRLIRAADADAMPDWRSVGFGLA